MRFGVDVPIKGEYFDPRVLADLAYAAEESGWDGFFVWDHISLGLSEAICDPWVALSAIALRTQRIRIGPMVTPLPRRRPWKLARETVTIDHLSSGRLTLGVGIGSPADVEFESFGDEGDVKMRGAMLDEGLARIPHLAQTSDAVNRQLSCFSSRYMNLLAVFQI